MATDPKERPSQIRIGKKYLREIKELAEAWFGGAFRIASVKGLEDKKKHFEILLVDAPEEKVKGFLEKYPMCKIENTLSKKK